jgi:hypothetical protein
LAVVVVAALLVGGGVFLARDATERAGKVTESTLGAAASAAKEIVGSFFSGNVTTEFLSSVPTVKSGGKRLEVARIEHMEIVTRRDARSIGFGWVSLGTNVAEIRVPATLRYHVVLDDRWEVIVDGPICHVRAPQLRPTLPAAIDTSKLEKRLDEGWLRFDGQEQLDELERTITPTLDEKASSDSFMKLAREQARRDLHELVRDWLRAKGQWGPGKIRAIEVTFPGEPWTGDTADGGTTPEGNRRRDAPDRPGLAPAP